MKNPLIKENISITISIIGCAFGLFALCLMLAKIEFDKDFIPVLIGVLGTITTVLIGWQIFTIFNLNKIIHELNGSVNKKIKEAVEACQVPLMGEIAYIRADRWRRQGIKDDDTMAFELAYGFYLDALECFIKYPNKDTHEELLEYFKDIIEVGKISEWISEEEKEKGVRIISMAQSRNKSEILKLLLTIEIKPSTINLDAKKSDFQENDSNKTNSDSSVQHPKQKKSNNRRRKHK